MKKIAHVAMFGAFFLVLIFPGETAYAKTSSQASTLSPAELRVLDATVNLYCKVKVGNKTISSTGTGVLISDRGIILTNAHVAQYFLLASSTSRLKSDCSVRTGSPAKARYKAELLYISSAWADAHAKEASQRNPKGTGEHDFALLYVTSLVSKKGALPETFPALMFDSSGSFEEGDRVIAGGYPAGGLKYKDIKSKLMAHATSSTITSIRSFSDHHPDLISLSPSKVASSGVSGGPMVAEGLVIGIAATMNSSEKKDGASLRGISISYIDRALRAQSGLTLYQMLSGDLKLRSQLTYAMQYDNLIKGIEKGFRTLR